MSPEGKVDDIYTGAKIERMVNGEEGHIDRIETQLDAMRQVGMENHLSQQLTNE